MLYMLPQLFLKKLIKGRRKALWYKYPEHEEIQLINHLCPLKTKTKNPAN